MIRYIFIVLIFCSGIHSSKVSNRIYHGKRVDNSIKYKFTVEIKVFQSNFCGGSLVSLKNVLTAAHCFDYVKEIGLSNYKVYAGRVDSTDTRNPRSIKRLRIHANYGNRANFSNDIALLDLKNPLERNFPGIEVAQIAPKGFAWPAGDQGVIFGWGLMENQEYARYLMHANITLISQEECLQLLDDFQDEFDEMMECALDRKGGKDACQADSGGPLIHMKTGYLIGIVSWGVGCGESQIPGAYTSVAYFHDWIKKNVAIEQ